MSLFLDGINPELCNQILCNLILADDYSGTELLRRMLIAEGIPALVRGENPRIIALSLCAALGDEYLAVADEIYSDTSNWYQITQQAQRALEPLRDKKLCLNVLSLRGLFYS